MKKKAIIISAAVLAAALALFGPAALAYLIAALVLPEKGKV